MTSSPRPLARRRLVRLAVPLLVTLFVGIALAPDAHAATRGELESCFLSRINSARASNGAGSLSLDSTLTGYARTHSSRMAANGSLYHSASSALDPYLPSNWQAWGENVGMASESVECGPLFQAFMDSSGHRSNLLDPAFDIAGVGVFLADDGYLWTTHVFVAVTGDTATATTTTTAPTTTTTAAPTTTTTAPAAPAPPTTTGSPTTTTTTAEAPATTTTTTEATTTTTVPTTTAETVGTTSDAPSGVSPTATTTTTATTVASEAPAATEPAVPAAAPDDPMADPMLAAIGAVPDQGACEGLGCVGPNYLAALLAVLAIVTGALAVTASRQ